MTTDELSRHALSFDLAADQFRERAAELQRLPPAFGGPSLLLHDLATKFEASYSNDFAATLAQADWRALLRWLARVADALQGTQPWYGEAHQFRIDTTDGIGRPTPEGAHRDGVDLVAVFLVARHDIKGGETRVFELDGPNGQRFTLEEPWSVLLIDDARVIHESTPIQPATEGGHGHRDTLVMTLRAGGFLDPEA